MSEPIVIGIPFLSKDFFLKGFEDCSKKRAENPSYNNFLTFVLSSLNLLMDQSLDEANCIYWAIEMEYLHIINRSARIMVIQYQILLLSQSSKY